MTQKQQPAPQKPAQDADRAGKNALSDDQLEGVSGGAKVTTHEIKFTKLVDKATP